LRDRISFLLHKLGKEIKMSVLIIGGSGFIGCYLVRSLLINGYTNVVSMDIIPPPPKYSEWIGPLASRFRFVPGSVSQLYDIASAIKSFSVEKIVNLAYLLPPASESDMPASISVNVVGNLNVFEAGRLLGVSRVVYASSTSLYGFQGKYEEKELTEEDPPHPMLVYGMEKHLAEKMAEKYSEQYGISTISFRPGVVFGHGRKTGNTALFSELISLPAVGKPFITNVDRIARASVIYVEDVVKLIKILLEAPLPTHRIYNAGGHSATLAALSEAVKEYIPDAKIKFGLEPLPPRYALKVKSIRAKQEFNFCGRPLREAVLAHINCAREEAGLKLI